jgi:hypothetical protein
MSAVSLEGGVSLPLDIGKLTRGDIATRSSEAAPDPAKTATLSVVIPVYNERHTLAAVLAAVGRALPGVPKDIIVVDDCSTDGTRDWLRANFPDGPRSGRQISIDGLGGLDLDAAPNGAP